MGMRDLLAVRSMSTAPVQPVKTNICLHVVAGLPRGTDMHSSSNKKICFRISWPSLIYTKLVEQSPSLWLKGFDLCRVYGCFYKLRALLVEPKLHIFSGSLMFKSLQALKFKEHSFCSVLRGGAFCSNVLIF